MEEGMTLQEIIDAIEGKLLVEPPYNVDFETALASDLMSDVLVFARPNTLLISGLTNVQSVRTAEMADIPAVIFVRGKYPPQQTLDVAQESGIAVVISPYGMFETAGLLYQAGLKGIGKLPIIQQR
jgi:hypothetical protein